MTAKVPESLKIARGTARKDRRDKPVKLVSGVPEKPDWLGEIGSAKWDEVVKNLNEENQLAKIYGDFIAMYCLAFDDLAKAERTIEIEGEYCTSEKGGIYQHPAVGVKNKAIERIMKFGRQMGMSAASIKHVHKTEKKDESSPKGRFFGKNA